MTLAAAILLGGDAEKLTRNMVERMLAGDPVEARKNGRAAEQCRY
jgi:hypothetical protein